MMARMLVVCTDAENVGVADAVSAGGIINKIIMENLLSRR